LNRTYWAPLANQRCCLGGSNSWCTRSHRPQSHSESAQLSRVRPHPLKAKPRAPITVFDRSIAFHVIGPPGKESAIESRISVKNTALATLRSKKDLMISSLEPEKTRRSQHISWLLWRSEPLQYVVGSQSIFNRSSIFEVESNACESIKQHWKWSSTASRVIWNIQTQQSLVDYLRQSPVIKNLPSKENYEILPWRRISSLEAFSVHQNLDSIKIGVRFPQAKVSVSFPTLFRPYPTAVNKIKWLYILFIQLRLLIFEYFRFPH
jgi:hypothetical protein